MALGQGLIQMIPLDGGLNTNDYPLFITTAEAQDIYNIDYSKSGGVGTVQKRQGSSLQNTGGVYVTATADSLYQYDKTNTSYLLSHFGNANLWYNRGADNYSVTITSLGTNLPDFATFTGNIYVVSSDISMQKWNGTTVTTVGGSPPANTGTICHYQNRLWTANNPSNPNQVWYSALLNPEDWATAGSAGNMIVGANDGDEILKLIPQKDRIIVLKERHIYAIYGTSPNTFFWELISSVIGCESKKSVASAEGIVIWRSKESVRAIAEGSNEPMEMSRRIKNLLETQTNKTTCQGTIYKNQYHLTFTSATTDDDILVIDLKTGKWWKYRDLPQESIYSPDNDIIYGAKQGNLYQLDTGTSDNTAAIGCYWKSGRQAMGDITKDKTFDKVKAVYSIDNNTHTAELNYSTNSIADTNTAYMGHRAEITNQVIKTKSVNFAQGKTGKWIELELRETSTYAFQVVGMGIYATLLEDE